MHNLQDLIYEHDEILNNLKELRKAEELNSDSIKQELIDQRMTHALTINWKAVARLS